MTLELSSLFAHQKILRIFKVSFDSDCVHTIPAHFESGEKAKNVTDRPPVHTKTAHFCWQILKTVGFGYGTLTGTI